jgi:hypothetical protein
MLFRAVLSSKKNLVYVLLTAIFTWALLVLPITYFQLSNPSTLFELDSWGASSSGNYPNRDLEEKLATNSVEFWYQFTDVNPQTGHLNANVYLWPSKDLATPFSSSTITKVPIKAFVDNISQNSLQQFSPGDAIGAIPVVLDMTNPLELERANEFYYPFDEYSLDNYAKVEIGGNNQKYHFRFRCDRGQFGPISKAYHSCQRWQSGCGVHPSSVRKSPRRPHRSAWARFA